MSKESSVKQNLRKIKYAYLKAQGHTGGDAYGYAVQVLDWLEATQPLLLPEQKRKALKLAMTIWEEELTVPDHKRLFLNGVPLPTTLRYRKEPHP